MNLRHGQGVVTGRSLNAGTVFKLLIMNIHESSTEEIKLFSPEPGPDLSLLVRAGQVLT